MSENNNRHLDEDKILRDKAKKALARMKQIEQDKESQLRTIIYSNGVMIRTNNQELIDFYDKRYGKL